MAFFVVYITHPDERCAQEISDQLVEEQLVACANIYPMQSIYQWNGAVQRAGEWVSILKTKIDKKAAIIDRVEELHPYEIPCITFVQAEANPKYEAWIAESVK